MSKPASINGTVLSDPLQLLALKSIARSEMVLEGFNPDIISTFLHSLDRLIDGQNHISDEELYDLFHSAHEGKVTLISSIDTPAERLLGILHDRAAKAGRYPYQAEKIETEFGVFKEPGKPPQHALGGRALEELLLAFSDSAVQMILREMREGRSPADDMTAFATESIHAALRKKIDEERAKLKIAVASPGQVEVFMTKNQLRKIIETTINGLVTEPRHKEGSKLSPEGPGFTFLIEPMTDAALHRFDTIYEKYKGDKPDAVLATAPKKRTSLSVP